MTSCVIGTIKSCATWSKKTTLPKLSRRGQGVWTSTCVSLRWWRRSATPPTPRALTQRASVNAGKRDKMGGSRVPWNVMIEEKEYFYKRRQHETTVEEKWPLYSAESQECEFLDEEGASGRPSATTRRPTNSRERYPFQEQNQSQRVCLHKRSGCATWSACLFVPFLTWFEPRQRPRSLQRREETTTGQLAWQICWSQATRWRHSTSASRARQSLSLDRSTAMLAGLSRTTSRICTGSARIVALWAEHVRPWFFWWRNMLRSELQSLQLDKFLAKHPLVKSLRSAMGSLVNMKRASMWRNASVSRNLAEDTWMRCWWDFDDIFHHVHSARELYAFVKRWTCS